MLLNLVAFKMLPTLVLDLTVINEAVLINSFSVHTCSILINFNRSIIEFTKSLHLYMVAMTLVHLLSYQIFIKILSYILTEKVSILFLQQDYNSIFHWIQLDEHDELKTVDVK